MTAPSSCASDHKPTVWVWEGYNDGGNRRCYCGFYLFRVDLDGTILWIRPNRLDVLQRHTVYTT